MIDPKDLRPIKLSEFQVGGHYYLKQKDGTFAHCRIDPDELKDENRASTLRMWTKIFCEQGRIFIRINKPWKHFNE